MLEISAVITLVLRSQLDGEEMNLISSVEAVIANLEATASESKGRWPALHERGSGIMCMQRIQLRLTNVSYRPTLFSYRMC